MLILVVNVIYFYRLKKGINCFISSQFNHDCRFCFHNWF